MKRQQGFTLIELIVVIVILGILAATALPKFTSLQVDARIAKLNAARGAVMAAGAVIHTTALARSGVADTVGCVGGAAANNSSAATGTVCTESGLVNMVFGYPAGNAVGGAAGVIAAAGLSPTFNPTLAQLNLEGYGIDSPAAGQVRFSVIGGTGTAGAAGAQTNATCSFTYTQSAAANQAPTVSVTDVTGC